MDTLSIFDDRTEGNIGTLMPLAQLRARQLMTALIAAGIPAKIISGNRSWADQDVLYAQGRTKPGPIVTNAQGGQSNHNFGIAWDIGIWDAANNYLDDSPLYRKAGSIGESLGLEWGGEWISIPDEPHYQLRTGLSVSQLRLRYQQGQAYVSAPTQYTLRASDASSPVYLANYNDVTLAPARAVIEAAGADASSLALDPASHGLVWDGRNLGAAIMMPRIDLPQSGPVAHVPIRALASALGMDLAAAGASIVLTKPIK